VTAVGPVDEKRHLAVALPRKMLGLLVFAGHQVEVNVVERLSGKG
jgi:hypothetical protein